MVLQEILLTEMEFSSIELYLMVDPPIADKGLKQICNKVRLNFVFNTNFFIILSYNGFQLRQYFKCFITYFSDTFIPSGGELPLPPLLSGIDLNDSNDEGIGNPNQNNSSSSNNNNNNTGNDAVVDVDVCCQRFMPASVMSKLNKLNLRNGLFKVLGEFSLRENLYYGSIFFCMTLIVIVCFVVINNRGGTDDSTSDLGSSSKMFDDGKKNKFYYIYIFFTIFTNNITWGSSLNIFKKCTRCLELETQMYLYV